jgi:multiple antibiotic resistance protein
LGWPSMSAGEVAAVASLMFAIMNPLTKLPLWLGFVQKYPARLHKRMAFVTSLASFIALLVVIWFGVTVLEFLEVTIEGIQVAGGLIIVIIGMMMVLGPSSTAEGDDDAADELSDVDEDDRSWVAGAVVPMAIPITVGGGVIAVVATIAAQYNSSADHLTISVVALAMSALSYFGYAYAPLLARAVGDSGLEIMTRVFGIVLAAIGFQVLFAGLIVFFPGLAS